MRKTNLTVRQLGKVPVREDGRGEILEQPVIDVRTGRLDRIESERWSAIDVGVEYAEPGIEPDSEQGNGHLTREYAVEVIQQRIAGRRRAMWAPSQQRGSRPKCQPRFVSTWPPSSVGSEPLWAASSEPDRRVLPQFPIDQSRTRLDVQDLPTVGLVRDGLGEV